MVFFTIKQQTYCFFSFRFPVCRWSLYTRCPVELSGEHHAKLTSPTWLPYSSPGPDLPGSLTHRLAASATASHHNSLQPVSTAAREPSKGENHTSSISVTSCRFFFPNMDPREKARWSRAYWRRNIIAGWVIRSICCLSLATKTWIPSFLRNNQHGALYPKKLKVG